jgi:hypothetical protein
MTAIEGYVGNCHPESYAIFYIICFMLPTNPNLGKIKVKIKVPIYYIYVF